VALALALELALLAGGPPPARAADAPLSPADAQRVEALAGEAKALRDERRFEEALAKLKEAVRIHPAAWLVYNLGRTYEDAGDDVLAKAHYELCLTREPTADVRSRADEGLARIAARMRPGMLRLDVPLVGTLVTVDGTPRGQTPLAPIELPPGAHRVRLEQDGFVPWEEDVTVPPGGEVSLRKEMVAVPPPPREVIVWREVPDAGAVEDRQPGPPPSPYSPWQWVTLGTGAALLGGGVALFVLGDADLQQVRDATGYGSGGRVDMTVQRAQDLEESGNAKRGAGIAFMAVGGAALATSVVLFVLDALEDDGASSAAQPSVSPLPGGAVFGYGGSF